MQMIGKFSVVICLIILNKCFGTPLDDYVNTPDSTFSWKLLQTYPHPTHTFYVLNMTSQKWFDDSFSTQSIWWHYVTITVPKFIRRRKTSFLLITEGSNTDPHPTADMTTPFAVSTGSIGAAVWQIPNQPFRFVNDPSNKLRQEDDLVAWTWRRFIDINGNDPKVLLYFPMTKAVVRAMDTIQQFLEQEHIGAPNEFIVGGTSKRGWTTWLTAAVDNTRVVSAVPIVMDLVNIRKNMMSQFRSLGGWTFVFYDYYALNITQYLTNPLLDQMSQMIDPYTYFNRYTKTKILQIQAAGDEFSQPDSEDFFWSDLQKATGGSYLRRIPNTGHLITGFEESLSSFCLSVADNLPLPFMNWTRTTNSTHGIIHAVIDFSSGKPRPSTVSAYQARTSDTSRRDFRQAKFNPSSGTPIPTGVVWANTAVQLEGQTGSTASYSVVVPIPSDGRWTATYIQAEFPGPEGTTLTLTTETIILPNTYPVGECVDNGCYGQLV